MERKPPPGPDESIVLELDSSLVLEAGEDSAVHSLPPPPKAPPIPKPPVVPPRRAGSSLPPVDVKRPATEDWFNELAAEMRTPPPSADPTAAPIEVPTPVPIRTPTARPPTATPLPMPIARAGTITRSPTPPPIDLRQPTPQPFPTAAKPSRAVGRTAGAHAALPPPALATTSDEERLVREAEALAAPFPQRAALLHAYRARAADLAGDRAAAAASCAIADQLAPDTRFVAHTRRWLARDPEVQLAAARAELPLAGDVAERGALLWTIALRELPDAAEKTWRQILELDGTDLGAWLALASSAMRRERWSVAIEAFEAAAAHTSDRVARGAFFASAAGIRQRTATAVAGGAGGEPGRASVDAEAGARVAMERAFEADPTSIVALAGLENLHLHGKAIADHARMVALEAERFGELDPALGLHQRAGDLYWECLRDGDAAAAAYEHAAALSERDVVPLGRLASVYEQMGRHAKLAAVYERLLERNLGADPVRRGAVLLRLGTLYESRLEQPDDAIRCYKAALDAAPTLAPAAQALARLYQQRQQWEEVAEVLLSEVNRLGDPTLRAARYVAIAELVEARVRSPEAGPRVVALYERALALDPSQATALDALDRIHRATGAWNAIAELHETQIAHAKHPMRVRALRLHLAAIYHDRMRAPERAAEQLRLALEVPPDAYTTLVALGRALAEAGKWVEHVEVLEKQAALLGGSHAAEERSEVVATLFRIAVVIEERLGDPVRALAAYERVLAIEARHELAVHATLRLHRQQARWDDAIASERRLLELTDRPEESAIVLHRVALVAEDRLAHPDEAIAAYETALVYLPSYRPARVALERLLRLGGKFERLAGLLLEQATDAASALERARLLCQAAIVRELHASGPAAATAATLYEDALAIEPTMMAALWGLERIRIGAGDWAGVVDVLGRVLAHAQAPRTRARLLVHAARIQEHRLRDAARAGELYEEAIGVDPAAAIVFERLRVALGRDDDDRATWLDEAARATTDPALAAALAKLRAIEAPSAETYAAAVSRSATPFVVDALAKYRSGAGLADALVARARQLHDPPLVALLHTLAAVLATPEAANRACAEALAAQPDFLPALEGRRRLAERADDWPTALATCAELARVAQHPINRVEAFEAAAAIASERLADVPRAIALYRDAIAAAPGRAPTLARALALFEGSGAWSEAAALIHEQVGHADEPARVELFARRARILVEHLGDPDGAIADLERALAIRPDAPILARLAELHEHQHHWAEASQVYERLGKVGDVAERRAALLAQARIWTTEVPDYARAQRILDEASQLDPSDRTVEARLAEIASLAGDTRRAAELYGKLARRGPALARAQALLQHVDLARQLGEQVAVDEGAFALAFEDPAVVPLLEDHFRVHANLTAYIARAETALATIAGDAPEGVPLRVSVGQIYAREMSAPERAIPYLHAAVAAAPDHAQLRLALGSALVGRDDAAAIDELRRVLALDPTEAAAYRRLAEVCGRMDREIAATVLSTAAAILGDDDTMARAASPAMFATPVPGSLPASDALARFVGPTRAGDVRQLVALLDPYLHELFPESKSLLAGAAPLPDKYPIAGVVRTIAAALGVTEIALYWRERAEPSLVATQPRAFVIAPEHVNEDASNRIRFDAAYGLARMAGGSLLGHVAAPSTVRALLLAIADRDADDPDDFRKRVAQVLPRRTRKDLEKLCTEITIDANGVKIWEVEERRRALCVGVVAAAGLRAVVHALAPEAFAAATATERRAAIRGNALVLDALRFAISDACWAAIQRFYGRG